MRKKSALLLFGLATLLVTIHPAQAKAEVVVVLGSPYRRPVYVRPYRYIAPTPYIAYRPYPYAYAPAYAYPGPVFYPHYYRPRYWAEPRFEHREFVERRPYWRR
jgi:hypothetical protein